MNAARLVVLICPRRRWRRRPVGGTHGKGAAPKVSAAPKFATVDVLVAKSNIGMGQKLTPRDIAWQEWPANANTGNFIRRREHPGAIARAPFVASEPIRTDIGKGEPWPRTTPITAMASISCVLGVNAASKSR